MFTQENKAHPILLVEDDEFIREAVTELLKTEGHEVLTAENGREALELLEEHQVSLVLLDLNMPVMNGTEVLRELQLRSIASPVELLSANADPAKLPPGAVAALKKPFDLHLLLETVERHRKVPVSFSLATS